MATNPVQLDAVLRLALKLSTEDKMRLAQSVLSTVDAEVTASAHEASDQYEREGEPWTVEMLEKIREEARTRRSGAEIAAWIETNPPAELVDPDITDVVEWVKAQRKNQSDRQKPYWDGEK